jgi:hypothetical protein
MKNRQLHVFLRRHGKRTRVAALSGVQLPECYARVHATDLHVAQRQSETLRTEAGPEGRTIFADVEVLVDDDVHAAMRAAALLSQNSSEATSTLRYVGTPRGLAGYIADLHALGIADGVSLIPLRAADSAERIIADVLPMLGLDIAQLSA